MKRIKSIFSNLKRNALRLIFQWAAFFGVLAGTSSNCPFCGRPACPTGIAGIGIVAMIMSLLTGLLRRKDSTEESHGHNEQCEHPNQNHHPDLASHPK